MPVFSNVLSVTNEQNVAASDTNYPDAERFFVFSEAIDHFDWDVDFHQNMIEMTYVSIYEQDHDHQYMYTSTKGFHFQDSEGILSASKASKSASSLALSTIPESAKVTCNVILFSNPVGLSILAQLGILAIPAM
jgi:hypothetical protein